MKSYLDNAATTMVCQEALDAIIEYSVLRYGNASSLHAWGREARTALEQSRERIASHIGADADELIFTGSGTESDNMAIKGIAFRHTSGHIITSAIEHPAVMETCKYLEKKGFSVTYLPVDRYGMVDVTRIKQELRNDTILISIMHANNEIGTIQPIADIGALAKNHGIIFHVDAVQTAGKLPINVKLMNIDLLSISSHKIHGPKGVGALYIRRGIKLEPAFHGGGHERGVRPSTENIAGIAGFAAACDAACSDMQMHTVVMTKLRDRIIQEVTGIDEAYLTGHPEYRLSNNASFYFKGIEGESLVLMLDDKGIAVSTGSACSSKKLQASHVLLAIGVRQEDAHGSMRVSLSRYTTEEEIAYFLQMLPSVIDELRSISPLWNKK